MAEVYTSIYFKSESAKHQRKLVSLFKTAQERHKDFADFLGDSVKKISGEPMQDVTQTYLEEIEYDALPIEGVVTQAGFCRADFLCGHDAETFAQSTLRFLDEIAPYMTLRAWGTGDEDPWEFWIKRENGESVQLQDSPGNGCDTKIVGTIYRWWHEGLPPKLREGLIDLEDIEDDEDSKPVSDAQYKKWLKRLKPQGDFERMVTNTVQEELGLSMIQGITDILFNNKSGNSATTAKADAISSEELNEDVIRALFSDLQAQVDAKNTDGVMKHYAKNFKLKITSDESGKKETMTLNHMLYRLSYKVTFSPEMQYSCESEIRSIKIDGDKAVVESIDHNEYIDPTKKKKVRGISEDVFELGIIDGKVQILQSTANQTLLH